MAQVVEPVEVKKYADHNQDWYQEQAEAWLQVVLKNPKDEWAWLNYIHARKDGQISEVSMPDEMIMSLMVQNIQDTYAYNYIMYMYGDEEFEKESAIKALKMLPEKLTVWDYETWMAYYLSMNDTDNYNKLLKGYYESGLIPKRSIGYAMNILDSMQPNSVYVCSDTGIALGMYAIQQCLGKHKDKVVYGPWKIYSGEAISECGFDYDLMPKFKNCDEGADNIYETIYALAHTGKTVYSDYDSMAANMVMTFTEEGLNARATEKSVQDIDHIASIIDTYDLSWIDIPVDENTRTDERRLMAKFYTDIAPYVPLLRMHHPATFERIKPYLTKAQEFQEWKYIDFEMLLNFDHNNFDECLEVGKWFDFYYDDQSRMIKRAFDNGNPDAVVEIGKSLLNNDDTQLEGVALLEKAIKTGNEEAGIALANHYWYDQDDSKNAIKTLEPMAKKGCVEAMTMLADLYELSYIDEYNEKKSLMWSEKAAEKGDITSMYKVAYKYHAGDEVKKDLDKALKWYENLLAVAEDVEDLFLRIGDVYSDDDYKHKDCAKAMEYYQKAAVMDNSAALVRIAYMYAKGKGVAVDMNKAHEYVDKAIEADAEDSNNYDSKGEFYAIQGDKDNAMKMWQKANVLGMYDAEETPLNDYIMKNFQEAPYDNASFSVVYPIDASIFAMNESAMRVAVDDVEITLCALGPDDMNVEDANALIEGMMDNVKELTEGQATIARTQKMVDNKVLKGFEAGENSENRMYIFAFDDEEHNRVVVLSFTANEKDPKEIMDKICNKIRWK